MDSGKPKAQALAIAYSMKRKKKMADGGMTEKSDTVFGGHDPYKDIPANEPKKPFGGGDSSSDVSDSHRNMVYNLVHGLISKKYAKGGMVDHDDSEMMSEAPDWHDEDFLSDEEQDHDINLTYPDPDGKEDTEGMDKKKSVMRRVMSRLMSK